MTTYNRVDETNFGRNMSGQEAIDKGIITEEQWQQAIAHPWVWVVISSALRIREIPWNGLELNLIKDGVK